MSIAVVMVVWMAMLMQRRVKRQAGVPRNPQRIRRDAPLTIHPDRARKALVYPLQVAPNLKRPRVGRTRFKRLTNVFKSCSPIWTMLAKVSCRQATDKVHSFIFMYTYILNENSTDTPCSHWHTHSIANECAVETAIYSFIHSLESCE